MLCTDDRVCCVGLQFVSYIDMRNDRAGHSVHCCVNYPAVKRPSISVSTAPNKT